MLTVLVRFLRPNSVVLCVQRAQSNRSLENILGSSPKMLTKEKVEKLSSVLNKVTLFGDIVYCVGNSGSFTSSFSVEV